MAHGDFYLAASAAIPVLLFSSTLQRVTLFRLPDVKVGKRAVSGERLGAAAIYGHRLFGRQLHWIVYGWAEWACLRSLETGHAATGGTAIVWAALALLGAQIVIADRWPSAMQSTDDSSADSTR